MADTPPPAGAQRLSQIVAAVEASAANLSCIDEVSWDGDGYWKVESKTTDGAEVAVRVDPVSGQTQAR